MYLYARKIIMTLRSSLCLSFLIVLSCHATIIERLIYGTIVITEPVIEALIRSQGFQRLKRVRQYGIGSLVDKKRAHTAGYTRYNHSLGVYGLTKRYGAPLQEQVAALLHDASHTAFSHCGDRIFNHTDGKDSYQDEHHLDLLKQTDIPQVLAQFQMTLADINHKNPKFTLLERDLPDICADRLEYNLAGGVLEGLITPHEVHELLEHLTFDQGQWYFTDAEHAKQFAMISLHHTEHVWGTQVDAAITDELAQAIERAFSLGILTPDDVKHGTDDAIWQRLCCCNNAQLQQHVRTMQELPEQELKLCQKRRTNKFRGINPLVLVDGQLLRLTELDTEFRAEYERIKRYLPPTVEMREAKEVL